MIAPVMVGSSSGTRAALDFDEALEGEVTSRFAYSSATGLGKFSARTARRRRRVGFEGKAYGVPSTVSG